MVDLDLDLWLTPADFTGEIDVYFNDAGVKDIISKPDPDPDIPVFNISVKMPDATNKIWTMNKTSQRAVAKAYGTDTTLWINRPATLFKTTQNVRGTMKEVIYAKTPDIPPVTTSETVA